MIRFVAQLIMTTTHQTMKVLEIDIVKTQGRFIHMAFIVYLEINLLLSVVFRFKGSMSGKGESSRRGESFSSEGYLLLAFLICINWLMMVCLFMLLSFVLFFYWNILFITILITKFRWFSIFSMNVLVQHSFLFTSILCHCDIH